VLDHRVPYFQGVASRPKGEGEAQVLALEHRNLKFHKEIRLALVGFVLAFGLIPRDARKWLQLTVDSVARLLDLLVPLYDWRNQIP
jgi:hypothetical protein